MWLVYLVLYVGFFTVIALICFHSKTLNSIKAPTIVSVKILGYGSPIRRKKGMLPADAFTKIFEVAYSNGRTVVKELHPNSWEYKEYMKFMEQH